MDEPQETKSPSLKETPTDVVAVQDTKAQIDKTSVLNKLETTDSSIMNAEERAKWEREFARLNRSYEFHLSFGLQAIAFFYAAVGAVLSIYFGGSGRSKVAIIILLVIPILMSFILGSYLYFGARLQQRDAKYMRKIAEKLEMECPPKVELLSELLYAFSALFFITFVGLISTGLVPRKLAALDWMSEQVHP